MKKEATSAAPGSSSLSAEDLHPLLECRHADPHRILGVRPDGRGGSVARVFHPGTSSVTLRFGDGERLPLAKVAAEGLFEAAIPGRTLSSGPGNYEIEATFPNGSSVTYRDSHAFSPVLGELDLYLLGQGEHLESYRVLGAHPRTHEGIAGTSFAVWAPNAQRVSVVGDFNGWDGRRHMMRRLGGSGIWELFVPGVGVGAHYKFELRGPHGDVFLKTDPCAFFAQHGLSTACLVEGLGSYRWNDTAWMERRARANHYAEPMSVYEVHLGSWRRRPEEGDRPLSYLELAEELVAYATEMGLSLIHI